jgi:drug/metabolite transporter (DMT)-like permease
VLALALLSTAVTCLIYSRLIATIGPTKTLTMMFLVSVFGLLFGVLFLDEPAGIGTLVGLDVRLCSEDGCVVRTTPVASGHGVGERRSLSALALDHAALGTPPVDLAEPHLFGFVVRFDTLY